MLFFFRKHKGIFWGNKRHEMEMSSKWSIILTQIICILPCVCLGRRFFGVVAAVKLTDVKKITSLTRLSRFGMKTSISWHYRTKIGLAPKRLVSRTNFIFKKCLPEGRQSAFHLLSKTSRIEDTLEVPRADDDDDNDKRYDDKLY